MLNCTKQVLEKLGAADRLHRKEASGRLLLQSVKYALAFVLAAFAIDVALHLTATWRIGLLLLLLAAVVALCAVGWYLAFVRRNRLEHIARFLETRDPALGSRLINLLQLQSQTEDPRLAPLTRDLAREAVETYAKDLRETPIEQLARTGELQGFFRRAGWALLGFAMVCGVFFRVTVVEVARFIDPLGDHPPYSFTRLDIVSPGQTGTNVIFGKGIVVKVRAAGHQPREVLLTSFPAGHPERAVTHPTFEKTGATYDQLMDNLRVETVVYAHTRDRVSISKQVRIGIVLTPQLEKASVRVQPPAYTGLKAQETAYAFKSVQALTGSVVEFRLQSNRPLQSGIIDVSDDEGPPRRAAMKVTGTNEVSASFVAEASGRLKFGLTDVSGLPSQGDWQGALTVTHDLPPEVRIVEPERDAFVAMDFKPKIHIEASDDYGLRHLRIHRGLNGVYSSPAVVTYDAIVRDANESMELDLANLGIEPGDVISLFVEAMDTAPEPHLTRSQTVRLKVISVEDYNNFLREQTDISETEAKYAALTEDLQELLEEQKKLGATAEKLKDELAKADARKREDLTRRLDDLLAKQNELNQKLRKHAERMDGFVRPDPVYDVEKELQETLQREAETVRQSSRTNDSAASDIASQSAPRDGRRSLTPDMLSDFKKASEEQLARLGGVQEESEREIAKTLEDMSLMQELVKDFNQFEALYRTQQELTAQAQAYDREQELSREDQLALKELAATEKQVGDLLDPLQSKLREDSKAAAELFPKAAKSGEDLANRVQESRLEPLARQAVGQMLAGNGDRSFRLADRLRGEMEKLFSECQGGNCPSGNELDSYLSLQRGMKPGNSFAQMSRSRKFGRAGKQSRGMAQGQGESGSSGYAMVNNTDVDVMGNEFTPSRGSASAKQQSRLGKGAGQLANAGGLGQTEKPDVMKGLNPVNRQSGSVASESVIEEYNSVVENYFKAITTRKKQ